MEAYSQAAMQILKDSYLQFILLLVTMALLKWLGHCRPSARTFSLFALPVVLMLAGAVWPVGMMVAKIYNPLLCIALLIDRFVLSPDPKYLQMTRTVANKFSIREPNPVVLHVINRSNRLIRGWVQDAFPEGFSVQDSASQPLQLEPYGEQEVTYRVRPFKRGKFGFGQIALTYQSPLGLLWLNAKGGRSEEIAVYPDLQKIRRMRVRFSRAQAVGELQKRKLGAEGTQFEGLRNYFTGDDVRKMDWKASARLDMPVTRVFTHEVEQPILILIDAGRKMQTLEKGITKFDWALNAALSFAGVAIDRGDVVGIGVFDQEMIVQPTFGTRQKHLKVLLDAVSPIQPSGLEPDYEGMMLQAARSLNKRSLVVVFTDLIDPPASQSLLKGLQAFARTHLLMVVTFQQQELLAAANRVPSELIEAYESSVTLDLLELRRKTFLTLAKSQGAIVIDALPEKLDEALIHRYLSVKLRNRL